MSSLTDGVPEDVEFDGVFAAATPCSDGRHYEHAVRPSEGREAGALSRMEVDAEACSPAKPPESIQTSDSPPTGGSKGHQAVALLVAGLAGDGVGPGGRRDSNARSARGESDRSRALRATQLLSLIHI